MQNNPLVEDSLDIYVPKPADFNLKMLVYGESGVLLICFLIFSDLFAGACFGILNPIPSF